MDDKYKKEREREINIKKQQLTQLNKKLCDQVELLKAMLNCENIRYIDIEEPYGKIKEYKGLINQLEYELEVMGLNNYKYE